MDKLLTVIIPVYNKIAYLKQCLDSVLSQNLNKIKIVVVDDGSTDESEKICDRYKQKMTVIHQEHKGLIAARERGLREADTKYVTFVDADDFIAGGMYEYMLSKADEYDADIVTCGCIRYWNEDDYAYDLCSEFQEGIYEKKEIEDSIIKKMLWSKEKDGWCLDPSLCMKIIKTELVKEQYTQIAGNNFLYCEDSAIIYPLIFRVNKIYISTAPYYYHRQRERTITAPYFVEEDFFEKTFKLYEYLKMQFQQLGVVSIMEEQLDMFYMNSVQLHRKKYKGMISNNYKWLFPFANVEKKSRIVLYGAGAVGRAYYEQVQKSKYCEVILWIDKYVQEENIIYPIEDILNIEYDYVVIARVNESARIEMKNVLMKMGVSEQKII